MKKVLFFLAILLCFAQTSNAQYSGYGSSNSGYGNGSGYADPSKWFLVDTTAYLLRNAIDHIRENEYGVKRVDLGWWDEYDTHYWLTYDKKDGYVLCTLYKILKEEKFLAITLLPRPDGHGFMIHPKSKGNIQAVLLFKDVTRVVYERNTIPATSFDE